MYHKALLIVIVCLYSVVSAAQLTVFDSLLNCINATKNDTVLMDLYYKLGIEHGQSNNDSALYYLSKGYNVINVDDEANYFTKKGNSEKAYYKAMLSTSIAHIYYRQNKLSDALLFFDKAYTYYQYSKHEHEAANSLNNVSLINYYCGNYQKALQGFESAKELFLKLKCYKELSSVYTNIGNIYQSQGNYTGALKSYNESLKIKEQQNDTKGIALLSNNIGSLYYHRKQYTEAIKYHNQFLYVAYILNDTVGIANAHNNLALAYHALNNTDTAKAYFIKAIDFYLAKNIFADAAKAYNNIGEIYLKTKNLAQAEQYFNNALQLRKKSGTDWDNGITLCNIALIYLHKANYIKSISYAKKAIENANNNKKIVVENAAYHILYQAYEQLKNSDKALEYFKLYTQAKDSLLGVEKQKELELIESRYELERFEQSINNQKLIIAQRDSQIAAQELQYKQERLIKNIFIIGFIIVISIIAWALRELVQRKKANRELIRQKHELIEHGHELSVLNDQMLRQRDHIEEQNEMLTKQKADLVKAKTHLEDSIHYGEFIQQAILPTEKRIKSIVADCFVLNLPKNIVGGDFYWIHEIDGLIIIAVGDCTGHGVPGGFLSMLGISSLKGIVNIKRTTNPAEILHNMRAEIIESLQQTGDIFEQNDGIDLAIAVFDKANNTVKFSGARANMVVVNNGVANLVKGDRFTVAIHPKMRSFTTQTLNFSSSDTFYFYTDGYVDQFNQQGEKFGRSAFIKLCADVYNKPFKNQKEIFYQNFLVHKANFEQIDDVTVLGIKV